MLNRARPIATTLLASTALTVMTGPAFADGVYGGCDQQSATATCTVGVTVPGSTPSPSTRESGSGTGGTSGSNAGASASPSTSPWRTLNTPCTYQADLSYKPPAGSDPHSAGSGAWYLMTCADNLTASGNQFATQTTIVWLTTPPTAPAPDPATLAATAELQLKLGTPVVETNPRQGLATFPGVNVWAWVPASSWKAQSASATAAGETVTATATPSYSTWDFGDGTTVTCQGPGTAYQASDGANPVSPTCGHDYAQPGSYTESVTVHWSVTWRGAGQAGAFNDLTTTTSVPVTVRESEAVVTR